MNSEIIQKFSHFKSTVLYKNRFFVSDHPFLADFKRFIEQDMRNPKQIMVSILPKGTILYRARIMDSDIEDNWAKVYITQMMNNCGDTNSLIENWDSIEEADECDCDCQKPSIDTAESFRRNAKKKLQECIPSSKPPFNGFDKQGSSIIPKEKSNMVSDMRANPKYIRYLYAANDKYTALLEARSNRNSLVSVANIKMIEPLQILDFTNPDRYLAEYDVFFELLQELNLEFSTPAHGELKEYLVSQVISEFVKNLNYKPRFDGICFESSLNPQGKNYTLFYEDTFLPVSSEVYYVNEIALTAYGITEAPGVVVDSKSPNTRSIGCT